MRCWLPSITMRKTLLTVVLLLAVKALFAQQDSTGPYVFTLDECIQYASAHQNDVVNARLSRQSSRERIREMRGRLLPHVSVTGNFTDNLKLQTSLIPDFVNDPTQKIPVQFGTKFSSSLTGEATQTLFNSDYFLGLRAAKVYDELSVRDLQRTAIDTRVQVSVAYFDVLVAIESIRIVDANLAQFGKTLKDTKARYTEGVAERIDVDRIQASFNSVENERANLERTRNYAYDVLKYSMGMPLSAQLEIEENVQNFTGGPLPDSLNYSVADRPEYAMQRVQVELNRLNLKSKKLEFLPTLNAFVNYGYNWFGGEFSELYKTGFGASALGLRLSWPIFAGTERIYQAKQYAITLQQSQNDLDYLNQQIQLQVRDAWTQYRNNYASYITQQKNIELTQGVYDRVVLKYEQGVSTSLDVISADNNLKQAQNEYITALINALVSKVKLDQAMGKIKTE
ncbi:TolC family protein [Chitinophaga sp. GCM10012297]|uniref:TolC family protein n=1 Tax=Chitinophaga chungangae TaxID=2821488 RepID=A0ABS3YJH9_9BACT|nr:TolC family protein [Chitinophaga chungangae]MBO9154830.1 TolC family protein [Chitinophaga chungangae]